MKAKGKSEAKSNVLHAVRGVTWAADQGMVFGLLGVNGAGKTTSFKMMSGIIPPSAGEVRILGIDVVEDMAEARQFIGYCPQFDAIIENLTVTEQLTLYGRMKGLVGQALDSAVAEKVMVMQLSDYADRLSGTLSGGNKRKLSVAMALMGEPPVIFLDEPSTGMDPFARRFMWGVIQDVADKRKQSVVVLTTHSMEEAQALCSKIAIQVDGQLRAFGSPQELKSQYGEGYELTVKFAPPVEELLTEFLTPFGAGKGDMIPREDIVKHFADDPVRSRALRKMKQKQVLGAVLAEWSSLFSFLPGLRTFLEDNFGKVVMLEMHGPVVKYRLSDMQESELPQLFLGLQERKAAFGLSDYSCSQASLEQIFISFAAQQEAILDAVKFPKSQATIAGASGESIAGESDVGE